MTRIVKRRINAMRFAEKTSTKCRVRLERGRLVRVLLGFEFRGRPARAPVAKVSKKLCQRPFATKLQAQFNEV
jgi:hypothetical protein